MTTAALADIVCFVTDHTSDISAGTAPPATNLAPDGTTGIGAAAAREVTAPILPMPRSIDAARPFTIFNPGWLFILAGIGILASTVLVPAQRELADARWARDRALEAQAHREARLENYREYLSALEQKQPSLVMALAASQLNQIPADRSPIEGMTEVSRADASVFAALEPRPMKELAQRRVDSVLARITSNGTTRLWLIAGGIVCLMLGLLPASRPRGEVPSLED